MTDTRLTYAVVGTGAIGGFYGSKLAHAGREVHFLLHRDYEHVRDHGLSILSCDGDSANSCFMAHSPLTSISMAMTGNGRVFSDISIIACLHRPVYK